MTTRNRRPAEIVESKQVRDFIDAVRGVLRFEPLYGALDQRPKYRCWTDLAPKDTEVVGHLWGDGPPRGWVP